MSRLLLSALLCAWLLGGAGPAAAERGEDGMLRLLFWQAPTTLNPHWADASKDWAASRIVYEPLASVDVEGHLVPFLAAEIPSLDNGGVAANGRSVTWKLKQGVQWADGEPFTADDVLFTYKYINNPEVGATSGSAYEAVDRVEAIDDHTVTIHFKDVNPAWSLPFVGRTGMIIPRHLFQPYSGENAKDAPPNRLAVGTGPYRVASFEAEDLLIIGDDVVNTIKIVYEINPYYREPDKPHFARVELRGGGDARIAAKAVFEDGTVDYAQNLQVDIATLERLETLGKARLIFPQAASVERIVLNFTDPNRQTTDGERSSVKFPHPILSDRRVRQALALAIDREAISALYGRAGPLTSNLLVAPKIYASPNTSWKGDLRQAAALLDEAGWVDSNGDGVRDKNSMPLRLVLLTSVNDVRQRAQEIIREDLRKIEPKIADASVLYGPVSESTNTWRHFYADLQMYSWWNNNPEPDDYMRQWLCSEAMQKANNWSTTNNARYCNPAYDALYERMSTELDPNQRRTLLIAMNDLLIEDVALIPLVERRNPFGISTQIALGRDPTPWDLTVWDIADWRRRQPRRAEREWK
jgi:peptide/nickel transport system substrate-binding protein